MSLSSSLPNFPLRLDYDSYVPFKKRFEIEGKSKCVPGVYMLSRKRKADSLDLQFKDTSRYPLRSRYTLYEQHEDQLKAISQPDGHTKFPQLRTIFRDILIGCEAFIPSKKRREDAASDESMRIPALEDYREPFTQQRQQLLKIRHRSNTQRDMSSHNSELGHRGFSMPPRELSQIRNEELRSQAARPAQSYSTNPSIPLSTRTKGILPLPVLSPAAFSVTSMTSVPHERLESYVLTGGAVESRGYQSTYQARQDSGAASPASPGSSTMNAGPHEPYNYPVNIDSPQPIVDDPSESETVPHHSEDEAPYAPGPPLSKWVRKYYDYYKWNRGLGYLKCTACKEVHRAPNFERTDNHYELLPTCVDCRSKNKRENRISQRRKEDKEGEKEKREGKKFSDAAENRICWNITESAGCGQEKNSGEFDIDSNSWSGHLAKALCKSCRAEKRLAEGVPAQPDNLTPDQLVEYMAEHHQLQMVEKQLQARCQVQPLKQLWTKQHPEHPAQRPGGRGVPQEHMNYTSHSYCKACKEYHENEDFDLVPFKKYEGDARWWEYPEEYCRWHKDTDTPDRPIFKLCPRCKRNWHSGQFGPIITSKDGVKKDPLCYNCLEHESPPKGNDKSRTKNQKKSR